ncbi:MAG: TrmH family RNA methyltransferase [Candidatus Gracilibacteria bacterium]|nr:TrmH family RNA methyltransferase [Candidatus Gracilibacteria bacterium]
MSKKYILLESIRSMQNVGAIFRNSDGAGYTKLLLTGHTPTPPRSDISKTALGAEETIDWEYYEDAISVVKDLKTKGFKIFAVELNDESVDYRDFYKQDLGDICLVMGNEVKGVSKEMLEIADKVVHIPMLGNKSSLNVSVAAGIVMYGFVN